MSLYVCLQKRERMYEPAPEGKKRRKAVGWIYTWGTHYDGKNYHFSRAILDKEMELMKMSSKEWEDCTAKTAEKEIVALIAKESNVQDRPN